jgi:hypothetical protein
MKNILFIEPDYKNKYPPLGLMKISTYHKQKGHNVVFFKGYSLDLKKQIWDRIYISTLFTFYWDKTIKTIKFYLKSVRNPKDIFIGGVMATLMKDNIKQKFDVNVVEGLLNRKGKLGYKDDDKIDCLLPDYSIVENKSNPLLNYSYPVIDSYIAYATRGCIRKCPFCAVPIIESTFSNSLSIAKQVKAIKKNFGEKRDLLLMDNNILASGRFKEIIEEIKNIGFYKGAKYSLSNGRKKSCVKRYVDFNQGIDARLLTEEKMKLLSEIAIKPLRIAFDDIKFKKIYVEKVKLAAKYGIENLSNYILFNFNDTPEDFYERLKINIDLNEKFEKNGYKSKIWSFPMKYCPISGEFSKNRKYIGKNWNKKYLRAIQCILLTTHGVVGTKKQFFEAAFGKNIKDFKKILLLPEKFIINRNHHLDNGDRDKLDKILVSFNKTQRKKIIQGILSNDFKELKLQTSNKYLLNCYKYAK